MTTTAQLVTEARLSQAEKDKIRLEEKLNVLTEKFETFVISSTDKFKEGQEYHDKIVSFAKQTGKIVNDIRNLESKMEKEWHVLLKIAA